MAQSIYQQHKPGNTDNLYLKLKDGDKVKLRLCSPPAINTYDGRKIRYNWIVWNHEASKPQVYNAGISVYSQIADLVEEWGEPDSYDIVVKRTGSGLQDTEYSVTPVRNSVDLTPVQKEEFAKIDLLGSCKGKWLEDYMKDGELPEALKPQEDKEEKDVVIEDITDEPINLDDIPF